MKHSKAKSAALAAVLCAAVMMPQRTSAAEITDQSSNSASLQNTASQASDTQASEVPPVPQTAAEQLTPGAVPNAQTSVQAPAVQQDSAPEIKDTGVTEGILPVPENTGDGQNAEVSEFSKQRAADLAALKTAYKGLCTADAGDGTLWLTSGKSEKSERTGKITGKAVCRTEEEDDGSGWTKVVSGKTEGYIKTVYLQSGDDVITGMFLGTDTRAPEKVRVLSGEVSGAETGKVYGSAQRDGLSVSFQADGNTVSASDGWTSGNGIPYASEASGVTGYAQKVTAVRTSWTGGGKTQLLSSGEVSDIRKEIVAYAEQFVGNDYKWGGTSLTNGTDCSGFAMSVYAHFGYSIPRSSASQSSAGVKISADELQPGDLIFYPRDNLKVGHVAIYTGNGKIVNALNSNSGIVDGVLDTSKAVAYRRIVG